jgi:hypothetical protein
MSAGLAASEKFSGASPKSERRGEADITNACRFGERALWNGGSGDVRFRRTCGPVLLGLSSFQFDPQRKSSRWFCVMHNSSHWMW